MQSDMQMSITMDFWSQINNVLHLQCNNWNEQRFAQYWTCPADKPPTHIYSVLTAIFPGESGLAGWPLNVPSLFIPEAQFIYTVSQKNLKHFCFLNNSVRHQPI